MASVQLAHQIVEAVAARRGQHTRRQAYDVIDKHARARCKFARCKHNVATISGAPRLEACFFLGKVRPGSAGTKVTFIHPKSLEGVLAELCSHPK